MKGEDRGGGKAGQDRYGKAPVRCQTNRFSRPKRNTVDHDPRVEFLDDDDIQIAFTFRRAAGEQHEIGIAGRSL